MDWLQFIADLAKALAWPIVVGIGFKMFGGELLKLLKDIHKVKIGSVELERQVREATVELASTPTPSPALPPAEQPPLPPGLRPPEFEPINRLMAVAEPTGSILQAWMYVEQMMKFLLVRDGETLKFQNPMNGHSALRILANNGYIDKNTYMAINNLRTARNRLAHGEGKASPDLAAEYVANAMAAIERLKAGRAGAYDDFKDNPTR